MGSNVSATIAEKKLNFLYHPKGITWAVVIITIAWAILQWTLMGIVALAVVILFLYGFKNPLCAITALLVSQMTITSFMIPTPGPAISLRLALLLITLFILREELVRKEIDLSQKSRNLIIPLIIFMIIILVSDLVNPFDFDKTFKELRNLIVGLLFIILIPAVIDDIKQFKTILIVLFIVATTSAFIGVLQRFNILGMSGATLIPDFFDEMGRVPGMGETQLELAYILPTSMVLIFGIYLSRGTSVRNRKLLIFPLLFMALAMYFTYTRSAIIALGLGIISVFLFLRTRIKWDLVFVTVFIILIYLLMSDMSTGVTLGGRSEENQENSAVARAILWEAGLAISLDNPVFGIGVDRFQEVSPQYASRINPRLIQWEENRYYSYTTLGNDYPHNDFMMMWLSHGTGALLIFILLHFVILHNAIFSFRRARSRFLRGISVGLAATLVAYVANAFYHNLLATIPLFWIIAGLSLVTVKLATKEAVDNNISI